MFKTTLRAILQAILDRALPPTCLSSDSLAKHRMGGGLDESAELAEAYAQIIKMRNAEARAARRLSKSSGRNVARSGFSRLGQWLQGQTPRQRPSQRRAAASV